MLNRIGWRSATTCAKVVAMRPAIRTWSVSMVMLLAMLGGTIAVLHARDVSSKETVLENAAPKNAPKDEQQQGDAGVEDYDSGERETDTSSSPESEQQIKDSEVPSSEKTRQDGGEKTETKKRAKLPEGWRMDKSFPRRTGSYLGGSSGAALAYAWFTTKQRELKLDYGLGPIPTSFLSIRVGDAFFEWFAVGFQVCLMSGIAKSKSDPTTAAFVLNLDTTFYPWRGLGLKPFVGLGFSYGQAGTEIFEIKMGGPTTLGFGISYEFRVSPLFTIGPSIQVAWITGDDYDSLYVIFALEFLKWFETAKG